MTPERTGRMGEPRVYKPNTLAKEWGCSERHVRNLIASGELRSWRLGGKLLRISPEAVREYECQQEAKSRGGSAVFGENGRSSGTSTASGDGTRLEPLTRAKLDSVRRPSMPRSTPDQQRP